MTEPRPIPKWYAPWSAWIKAGKPRGKRPKTAPAYIPKWAWDKYAREHKPPAPPSPPAVDLSKVQNVLFYATPSNEAIDGGLSLPPRWRFAFSADPTYKPSADKIARVIHAGRDVWAWCDCHTTFPPAAKQMVSDFGLSDWYGEAESAAAFNVAYFGGTRAMIGNLSELDSDQRALVDRGDVLFVNENYRNKNPEERPNWGTPTLRGVGSNAGAVYASANEGAIYTSISSQIMNGWFGRTDSWYVESFTAADWQALRELG